MEIRLTVPPDPVRARRQVRAALRSKFRKLYVLGALLVIAGVVLVVGGHPSGYAPLTAGAAVLGLPWLLPRAVAKARTGLFAETATYELTDDEVRASTPSFSIGYGWEAVRRVDDTDGFWVVVADNSAGALALPWRLLPEADRDPARAFLVARGLLKAEVPVRNAR
ncbi:hypothetical protein Drose_31085 [Dactylosporangium roseum]|uniref:YcxB-like protein domain-containing protein n=1 Tax=Dactylosporangium roseum TaxID=47989 RepID=A0ABY5Z0I5_9ACTN|nr:hypothetical protein [Dactylosporangium roseum]UWZ35525.1 hypothetical protein Drose_31085 [Dactylosporangium roseum]